MKQYTVIYEKSATNWGAIVPDLPGCVSIGDTLEEVQENVKQACCFAVPEGNALYVEVLGERGKKIPELLTKVGLVEVAI